MLVPGRCLAASHSTGEANEKLARTSGSGTARVDRHITAPQSQESLLSSGTYSAGARLFDITLRFRGGGDTAQHVRLLLHLADLFVFASSSREAFGLLQSSRFR
jgi:hypothetical protein